MLELQWESLNWIEIILLYKYVQNTVSLLVSLTILWVHEVMEELWTIDHHNLTDIGRLPAGQVVPHPRTHWAAGDKKQ